MTYDNWKDKCVDVSIDNQELRKRIKDLNAALNEANRLRLVANMDLRFANEKLRGRNLSTVPVDVGDGEFECEECNHTLDGDWWACPGCGKVIDWDNARDSEGNWYAEEGERFLQAEVYDPIREAMRS